MPSVEYIVMWDKQLRVLYSQSDARKLKCRLRENGITDVRIVKRKLGE